jgi:hypothetical protein
LSDWLKEYDIPAIQGNPVVLDLNTGIWGPGHEITAGGSLVKVTGQLNFSLVKLFILKQSLVKCTSIALQKALL